MARKKASITSFLFGVLFGILLVIGSVAYGGYWVYNNLSIDKFESLTGQQISFIESESQLRTLTLKDIIGRVQAIPEMTFGQFRQDYGIQLPPEMSFIFEALDDVTIKDTGNYVNALLTRVKVGSILGDPYSDFDTYPDGSPAPEGAEALLWELRGYTIAGENGIEKVAQNLTLGKLKNIFGISFPSFLPIDDDTPISEIGNAIDTMPISSVITPPDEGDDSMGAKLLRRILSMKKIDPDTSEERDYYIGEVSELLQSAPSGIYVNDIMDMPDEGDNSPAAHILRALLKKKVDPDTGEETDYYKLSEINELLSSIDEKIYIRDIIGPPTGSDLISTSIINELRNMTNAEGDYYTIDEIGAVMELLPSRLTIKDLLEEPAPTGVSGKVLHRLWENDSPITELSSAVQQVVNELRLQDIITDEPDDSTASGRILNKIWEKNPLITGFEDEIEEVLTSLTIQDLMSRPAEDGSIASRIMIKLYDDNMGINEIEAGMSRVIDSLELGDVLPQPASTDTMPDKLLYYLINAQNPSNGNKPYKLTEITSALGEIKVSDVFDPPAPGQKGGIFDIIGWDTKLSELGGEGVTNRIKNATMQQWQDAGFISDGITLHENVKDKTLEEVIGLISSFPYI